jgi:hypothetical protein
MDAEFITSGSTMTMTQKIPSLMEGLTIQRKNMLYNGDEGQIAPFNARVGGNVRDRNFNNVMGMLQTQSNQEGSINQSMMGESLTDDVMGISNVNRGLLETVNNAQQLYGDYSRFRQVGLRKSIDDLEDYLGESLDVNKDGRVSKKELQIALNGVADNYRDTLDMSKYSGGKDLSMYMAKNPTISGGITKLVADEKLKKEEKLKKQETNMQTIIDMLNRKKIDRQTPEASIYAKGNQIQKVQQGFATYLDNMNLFNTTF